MPKLNTGNYTVYAAYLGLLVIVGIAAYFQLLDKSMFSNVLLIVLGAMGLGGPIGSLANALVGNTAATQENTQVQKVSPSMAPQEPTTGGVQTHG